MKALATFGATVFGLVGAYIPVWLFNANPLGGLSILGSVVGGIIGVFIGVWAGNRFID